MKTSIKLILVILFFLTTISSVQAQSHYRRSFYGDFFGGMTLASMDIENGNMFKKNKMGFMIGGNANFKVYSHFNIQTGLHIIKKGSLKHENQTIDKDGPLEKRDIKKTVDANYVQIPLNIGFEIPLTKDFRLNMYAGAFAAMGFKGETKQKGYTAMIINGVYQDRVPENRNTEKTFTGTNLKKLDYGVSASVGLVYDIFILRFQYDHGLADVATEALKSAEGTGSWKTRNYALCVGFRF